MKVTDKAEIIQWPATHYVYIEKIGPFQETAPKAWQELHAGLAGIANDTKLKGFMSLYKVQPQMLYCAGVAVQEKPEKLPDGFKYMRFEGGKYSRYTMTGSYANLPEACGMIFSSFEKSAAPMRDDFFIENYVNDPKTTPEDQLVTEILIPTR